MNNLPQLPNIPEEEQTPVVKAQLALLEQYSTRIVLLEESVAGLKDEINILKGEKKRPKLESSKLDKSTDKKSGSVGDKEKKRAGSKKRSKTAQLKIHEDVYIAPGIAVSPGSRFKGYRDFVVQDLNITSRNTCYRLERWITPQGDTLSAELPVQLNGRHFGPELVRFILYQRHHCQTKEPLLLEQLREYCIDISVGQIEWILSSGHEKLHEEKDARHQDYILSVDATQYMEQQKLPLVHVITLHAHLGDGFENEALWLEFLDSVNIRGKRLTRIASEGALLGSVLGHGFCKDLVIVSDDTGQFDILQHALCWIHAERLVHKTLPLNEQHRQDIKYVRGQIWELYTDLKAFKDSPEGWDKKNLAQRIDQIFTHKTQFATLNQLLKRIHPNKADLLQVLQHPEIPLHTSGSETEIRDYVKKRKVSGGTRSDEGQRCRDTFISLKKTCRKLGISFCT